MMGTKMLKMKCTRKWRRHDTMSYTLLGSIIGHLNVLGTNFVCADLDLCIFNERFCHLSDLWFCILVAFRELLAISHL